MNLVDLVLRRLDDVLAFSTRGAVVAGVSGGVDSMALLDALDVARKTVPFELSVVHLDHALRPESVADARFVAEVAAARGLEILVERADVAEIARRRRAGIEETGRAERYRFFGQVARERGGVVATGHTADDQVETIVLNIIRGSGVRGLRGMSDLTRPEGSGVAVWRPLLAARRADTVDHCRERGIAWREDASNRSRDFRRNRVRHDVLPQLAAINPRIDLALLRLAENARVDEDYLDQVTEAAWITLRLSDDDMRERWGRVIGVGLWLDRLVDLHPAVQRRVLRRAAASTGDDSPDPGMDHVAAAVEGLALLGRGAILEWPGGVRLIRGTDAVLVAADQAAETVGGAPTRARREVGQPTPTTPIAVPGVTLLPSGHQVLARLVEECCADLGPWHVDISHRGPVSALKARARRAGDRIRPLRGIGSRKVSDLMIDARLPRWQRDTVPIVEDDAGILWLAGIRADERAGGPGPYICLTVQPPRSVDEVERTPPTTSRAPAGEGMDE